MKGSLLSRFLAYGRRYLWPLFSLALLFNFAYGASTAFVPLVIRFLLTTSCPPTTEAVSTWHPSRLWG